MHSHVCYSDYILYRLSYAVYLIDKLAERHVNAELFIMYDVACTLKKYLKVQELRCVMHERKFIDLLIQHCGRDDILERIRLCLPTFHSYGHKATCQVYNAFFK